MRLFEGNSHLERTWPGRGCARPSAALTAWQGLGSQGREGRTAPSRTHRPGSQRQQVGAQVCSSRRPCETCTDPPQLEPALGRSWFQTGGKDLIVRLLDLEPMCSACREDTIRLGAVPATRGCSHTAAIRTPGSASERPCCPYGGHIHDCAAVHALGPHAEPATPAAVHGVCKTDSRPEHERPFRLKVQGQGLDGGVAAGRPGPCAQAPGHTELWLEGAPAAVTIWDGLSAGGGCAVTCM